MSNFDFLEQYTAPFVIRKFRKMFQNKKMYKIAVKLTSLNLVKRSSIKYDEVQGEEGIDGQGEEGVDSIRSTPKVGDDVPKEFFVSRHNILLSPS